MLQPVSPPTAFLVPRREHRVARLGSHGRRAVNPVVRDLPFGLRCWISLVVWPPEDPRSADPRDRRVRS